MSILVGISVLMCLCWGYGVGGLVENGKVCEEVGLEIYEYEESISIGCIVVLDT